MDQALGSRREGEDHDRSWVQLIQNRFWLLVPVLVLDLALTGRLPPPLAPGSAAPQLPAWLGVAEWGLRIVVLGLPLLMPLSLRTPGARPGLVVYGVGLAAYVAAWVSVVWAPTSAWSTSAVGLSAPAWTSILFLVGVGWGSSVRSLPGYRPWMYLVAAAAFTVAHTVPVLLAWGGRA